MLDSFTKLVYSARSHRRFDASEAISRDTLLKLVDVARVCPSAMNAQPLRYRIVSEAGEVAEVFECTNWARGLRTGPAPTAAERASGYILILSHQPMLDPKIDVGISGQTIQLAAAAAGYAACMLLSIDRARLTQCLQLPAEMNIELLIGLGRPGEEIALEVLGPGVQTPYWRTPDQVHHVPKRKLTDIVI